MKNTPVKFNSIIDIVNFIMKKQIRDGKHISVKMMFGNGDKQQYKNVRELEKVVEQMTSYFPVNDLNEYVFIYFGDVANRDKPDIGYAYEYLSKLRPDIIIIMIQIKEMEKYGIPSFVNGGVYFHSDYDSKHKWGGMEEVDGKLKVFSNTKQWFKLHECLKQMRQQYKNNGYNMTTPQMFGIEQCYLLGTGGPIAKQEVELVKLLNLYSENYDEYNDIEFKQFKNLESRY
jgi:hypothetical protein